VVHNPGILHRPTLTSRITHPSEVQRREVPVPGRRSPTSTEYSCRFASLLPLERVDDEGSAHFSLISETSPGSHWEVTGGLDLEWVQACLGRRAQSAIGRYEEIE
jgi:hypothetical protein